MNVPASACKPCAACDKPILFVITGYTTKRHHGQGVPPKEPKWMPVDPEPDDGGNVVLSRGGSGEWNGAVLNYNQRAAYRAHGHQLHTSHMQTCVNRDKFIRQRGRR